MYCVYTTTSILLNSSIYMMWRASIQKVVFLFLCMNYFKSNYMIKFDRIIFIQNALFPVEKYNII